jgi:cytidylate kinase
MSMGASRVSAIPRVRAALLEMQRKAGRSGGVVLEGRDIGTVVFPDAEVKFFLTASPEVRAQRRFEELAARGQHVSLDVTLAEVIERDRADTERKVAPLRRADDAILMDSSERDVGGIIEEMARVVRAREG